MIIKVNGENKQIEQNRVHVLELLRICDVEMPDMVSVQLNGEFVDKKNYSSVSVKDGDEVDFLYFMGGGN